MNIQKQVVSKKVSLTHLITKVTQASVLQDAQGRVLLLQLPDGRWHFPGGRLNEDETWEQGLRREVQEETGIVDFEVRSVLGVGHIRSRSTGNLSYGVFFSCHVLSNSVLLSAEHSAYRWVSQHDDLHDFVFHNPNIHEMLIKVL